MSDANICSACGELLLPAARFCSRCGFAASGPAQPAAVQEAKWYHNTLFVLFMLFIVLQVFGLPLVWKNPKFSRPTKMTLTILTILETVILTVIALGAAQTIVQSLLSENSDLKSLFAY